MTTHHHPPTPQDPMPLDAEERALAARLARLGPHGEPSPALDARVLAAAHAAATSGDARAAARNAPGMRGERGWRRARWPVGIGVAASLALAVGIAWQMRPLPAPVFPPGAPAPDRKATNAAAERPVAGAAPAATQAPQPISQLAGPPPREASGTDTASTAAAPANPMAARGAAAVARRMAPPPPEEPPIVFDEPAAVDVAAPPPAPPAPPAPAVARPSPAPPQPRAQSQSQDALPVFDDADAPETDVPPATAASPRVRDAWLARIRELAAAGRADDARASLAEFRRRYPAFAIPEDLRPLLPPQPPSPSPSQPQPAPPPSPPQ